MKSVILAVSLVVLAIAAVVFYPRSRPKDFVLRAITGEAIRVRLQEQRVVALEFDYQGRTYVAPAHTLSGLEDPVFPRARVFASRPFEKLPTVYLSLPVKLQPGDRVIGTNAAYLFSPAGEFRRVAFDPQVTLERLAEAVRRQRERTKHPQASRPMPQAVTPPALQASHQP